MSLTAYPWLVPLWQQLLGQLTSGRLPQGLLLSGPVGVGKLALGRLLAQRWLCQGQQPEPCGQCQSCQLWGAGSHPDYRQLQQQESSRVGIDEVRNLQQQLATTAYLGGRRAVLIHDAAQLTDNAANALLKTLEEPPQGTLLILTVARRESLLATINSRCQHWPLPQPDNQAVQQRLAGLEPDMAAALSALCQHAPLTALALISQPPLLAPATAFLQWRRDGRHGAALADALSKGGPAMVSLLWQLIAAEWPLSSRAQALQRVAAAVAAVQLPGRNLALVMQHLLNDLAPLRAAPSSNHR